MENKEETKIWIEEAGIYLEKLQKLFGLDIKKYLDLNGEEYELE
jgi:hypothetical protein